MVKRKKKLFPINIVVDKNSIFKISNNFTIKYD